MAASLSASAFNICTYNMRGFTSGFAMLQDLSLTHQIIAVQEHWLDSSNIYKLGLINSDFRYYGISGMSACEAKYIRKGRPFGGVAFLWHKHLIILLK